MLVEPAVPNTGGDRLSSSLLYTEFDPPRAMSVEDHLSGMRLRNLHFGAEESERAGDLVKSQVKL